MRTIIVGALLLLASCASIETQEDLELGLVERLAYSEAASAAATILSSEAAGAAATILSDELWRELIEKVELRPDIAETYRFYLSTDAFNDNGGSERHVIRPPTGFYIVRHSSRPYSKKGKASYTVNREGDALVAKLKVRARSFVFPIFRGKKNWIGIYVYVTFRDRNR